MDIDSRIKGFFISAMSYYGKEVALTSNQYFGIDQLVGNPNDLIGDIQYKIQYGYPQSGCVSMNVNYSQVFGRFRISGVEVYAPPKDMDFVLASAIPETNLEELSINYDFGVPNGSVLHKLDDIMDNPNAVKMLEYATADLATAEVLGPCHEYADEGSDRVPITTSTRTYKQIIY